MADSPLLTAALAYAARGWPVFPCAHMAMPGRDGKVLEPKRPLCAGGFHSASCTPEQIRAWWGKWPEALIAVPTGPRTGWVLDLDRHPGKLDGLASLVELEQTFGALPDTLMVRTASDGRHLWWRYPEGRAVTNRAGVRPSVDVRGEGGYVIVPPSVSERGRWEWREEDDPADGAAMADAPDWLLDLVCRPAGTADPNPRPAAPDAPAPSAGAGSFFAKVNSKALARLADWVPVLFPGAKRFHDGFRVTSRALGRDLEEDLSILPIGIQDFGEERGRSYGTRGLTPIDLVLEWGSPADAKGAALWLCAQMGVEPAALGWREALPRPPAAAPLPPADDGPPLWGADGGPGGDDSAGWGGDGAGSTGGTPPPPADGSAGGGDGGRERPAWADRLLCTDKGSILPRAYNVRLILEHVDEWRGTLGWCEFSQRVWQRRDAPIANAPRGEWSDAHDLALQFWLADRFRFEPPLDKIAAAVEGVAQAHRFHPVHEYLDGLTWDGRPRVETWLVTYLGAGNPDHDPSATDEQRAALDRYLAIVGRWWLVQSIARIRRPGCKADYVPILEGEQGIKKSSAVLTLYSREFASDTRIDFANKDAMLSMAGTWLVELPELEGMNKADARTLKAFISSAEDRFRLPYGHRLIRFPRQSIMVGTTNQAEIFRDFTGNRRYWPIQCGDIDVPGILEDRDQLWAEADLLYRRGARWWPETTEERALVEEQQGDRVQGDVWELKIQEYLYQRLAASSLEARRSLFISLEQVMTMALGFQVKEIKPQDASRAGTLIHSLGWRPTRPRRDGQRVRGYRPGAKVLAELGDAAPAGGDDDYPW